MLTIKNQSFTILQFTDIHIGQYPFVEEDLLTLKKIDETLQTTPADLICITGDLIWSEGVTNPEKGYRAIIDILNNYQIPVVITYGNHDSEEGLNRTTLRDYEKMIKNFVTKSHSFIDSDDKEAFTVEIKQNNEVAHVLYFFDSGSESLIDLEGYDWVSLEQVDWYEKTARLYRENGHINNDLAFLHIPLPEFEQAGEHIIDGSFWEMNPRIASPKLNSGLFARFQRNQHIQAIFCGHDHDNNFEGLFMGIHCIYGNVTGYNCYGVLPRGYRKIVLSDGAFKTQIEHWTRNN
ncbi:hypothetical protein IGI37_003009 [Enterococcus sp. AZ194]|uniref:metallophosphoesterase family protein n=1 Tax=Enterococcus sp. AZ194 TaxID=2774629 RepID=UPI003F240FAB